jgi:hypothetical protein
VQDRELLVRLVDVSEVLHRLEWQRAQLGLGKEQVPDPLPLLDRGEGAEGVTAGDERHAAAIGDERTGVDERRRARAEHRVDVVPPDQARRVVRDGVRVGLVVEDDELDLLLLAVNGDPALGVDLVDRVLITPLHERAETRERLAQG